jgi:hypothetical protein
MIYKEPGNYNLDKLRVIHLFEADFNLVVGILFGRRAMYHAKDNNLLHDGQAGRLGSECMDVTLIKVLHITTSHLTKTSLGLFESDAEACFDRIVMLMAFLASFQISWGAAQATPNVGADLVSCSTRASHWLW